MEETESTFRDACARDDLAAVQAMLRGGLDVDQVFPTGWTPLSLAAIAGARVMTTHLLAMGARLAERGRDGSVPLWVAVHTGNREAVQALLNNGADRYIGWRGSMLIDWARITTLPDDCERVLEILIADL